MSLVSQYERRKNNLLIGLPHDIYNLVCCSWLRLREVGLLDCAMTQSSVREEWLEQLTSKSMEDVTWESRGLFSGGRCDKASDVTLFKWIGLRNIPMQSLYVRNDFFDSVCFSDGNSSYKLNTIQFKFKVNFSNIQFITVNASLSIDASKIINKCINLIILEYVDDVNGLKLVSPSIMSKLIRLSQCTFDPENFDKIIDNHDTVCHIAAHCRNLKSLQLFSKSVTGVYTYHHDIIRNNPNLMFIEVVVDWKALELILIHCKNLIEASIFVDPSSTVDVNSIDKSLLKSFFNLQDVWLVHGTDVIKLKGKFVYFCNGSGRFEELFSVAVSAVEGIDEIRYTTMTNDTPHLNEIVYKSRNTLKKLRVNQVGELSADTVNAVLQCKQLTQLKLYYSVFLNPNLIRISFATVKNILKALEQTLENFSTSYSPGKEIKLLRQFLKNEFRVGLPFCYEVKMVSFRNGILIRNGKLIKTISAN